MRYERHTPRHIKQWSQEHPEVSKTLLHLGENGIRAGIYCGTAAEIGMRHPVFRNYFSKTPAHHILTGFIANQLTLMPPIALSHEADDIDLIVHNDDFSRAVYLLDATVDQESRTSRSVDNLELDYELLVAHKKIGAKVIEICHTNEPMIARQDGQHIEYHWSINDYVTDNFLNYRTREGLVPLAHPSETDIIYGIIQRPVSANKRLDIEKLLLVRQLAWDFPVTKEQYFATRETQLGVQQSHNRFVQFNERVSEFWDAKNDERLRRHPRGSVWLENWPGY